MSFDVLEKLLIIDALTKGGAKSLNSVSTNRKFVIIILMKVLLIYSIKTRNNKSRQYIGRYDFQNFRKGSSWTACL